MTYRDVRLSLSEQIIIIGLLITLPAFLFPVKAAAQNENQPRLVFEIKNYPIIEIPEVEDRPTPQVQAVPIITDGKIYMHEPEIRTYVCPKLGNKCNTFIAILKAENGTHECTRDNKGLNKNGSVDVGLAQINWNPKHNPPYTLDQLRDCKFNLDIALKKIENRGFQPWVAYNKGHYKKFLKTVSQIN